MEIALIGGSYTIEGEVTAYQINYYPKGTDDAQAIVRASLHAREIFFDEEGKITGFRFHLKEETTEVIGNYPVISQQEATALLRGKKYITTVPNDFPGTEYIEKVTLRYRSGAEGVFAPYYVFYVRLPEQEKHMQRFPKLQGMTTFGLYYVPAIPQHYVKDMDTWDGTFAGR